MILCMCDATPNEDQTLIIPGFTLQRKCDANSLPVSHFRRVSMSFARKCDVIAFEDRTVIAFDRYVRCVLNLK